MDIHILVNYLSIVVFYSCQLTDLGKAIESKLKLPNLRGTNLISNSEERILLFFRSDFLALVFIFLLGNTPRFIVSLGAYKLNL